MTSPSFPIVLPGEKTSRRTELFMLAEDGWGWAEVLLRRDSQLVELTAEAADALVGQIFCGYKVIAVEWGNACLFRDYDGYRIEWAKRFSYGASEEMEDEIREAVLAAL